MDSKTTTKGSVSGEATIATGMDRWAQFVLIPEGTVQGTISVFGRYAGGEEFVPVTDSEGAALEEIALSNEFARTLTDCRYAELRFVSTNSDDRFDVAVSV